MEGFDERIMRAVQPCLDAVVQLRHSEQLPPAPTINQRMQMIIERMDRELSAVVGPTEIEHIKYAVVALTDETAQGHAALGVQWTDYMLQTHYFDEFSAGENFFVRLNDVMAGAFSGPHRASVLRVYYDCLILGFKGKYGRENERMQEIDRVRAQLDKMGIKRPPALSRAADRPPEAAQRERRRIWILMLPVAMALIAIIAYVGMQLSVSSTVEEAVEVLERREVKG